MTQLTLPAVRRDLPAMPVYFGNPALSFLAVTWFPDDLELARKLVARRLLRRRAPQNALEEGVQLDGRYLAEILDAVADGRPTEETVDKRRYHASAVGQIVKTLYAIVCDNDPRVQQCASEREAIQQAERMAGRPTHNRRNRSSFDPQLKRFRRVLHMAAVLEMTREGYRPARTAEAAMSNAMIVLTVLHRWHSQRQFPGSRSKLLDGDDFFWRWPGMRYYPDHGVPVLALGFDRLTRNTG